MRSEATSHAYGKGPDIETMATLARKESNWFMVLSGLSPCRTLQRLGRNESPILTRGPLSISVAMLLSVIGPISAWALLAR